MLRKISSSNNNLVEVLRVPWCSQQENSSYCFPYSLWMIFQFYKNIYEDKLINKNIPDLSVEEIVKICKTDLRAGTRINDQLISTLNNRLSTLKFELLTSYNFEQLKKTIIDNKCPAIIIYDCGFLMYNVPSKVAHAGVVIGMDDNSIFLNNPWLGAEIEIDKVKFNDCWEIEYNQILLIKPNLQTNLNEEKFDKNANKNSD